MFLASDGGELRDRARAVRRRRLQRRVLSGPARALMRAVVEAPSGIIGDVKAGTVAAARGRSRFARPDPANRSRRPRPPPRRHSRPIAMTARLPPLPPARRAAAAPRTPGDPRAGRRHGLSRPRDRRAGPRRRRGRVQHRDDGLPGDPDRSVLRRADRHAHLSAHRQHRRQPRGRRVDAAVRRRARHPRPAARSLRTGARRATSARTSRANGIVGIADIDTRRLTRMLRDKGAQNGCIVAAAAIDDATSPSAVARGARRAVDGRAGPRAGRDLHRALRVERRRRGRWARATGAGATPRFHVVAYDFGVKHNILRMLAERGCRVTVVPAQTPARRGARAASPTACSCPTAPATPSPATTRSRAIRDDRRRAACRPSASASATSCSGSPSGAKTVKMKFGHHGANHPVQDLRHRAAC